ncbi:MAG TPA: M15 family metallopeptidase, partial [Gemmatimonadales bacterium]
MSNILGMVGALTQLQGRAEPTGSTRAPDGASAAAPSTPFAALLGAALAARPAARPLTQPAAAGTTPEMAEEQATAPGTLPSLAAHASAGVLLVEPQETVDAHGATHAVATAAVTATVVTSAGVSEDGATEAATEGGVASASSTEEGSEARPTDGPRDAGTAAVHRELDWLVPEMRERLARVLDRMRNEHGHDVRVSETYRSQARQDALHAQGRSAPGQVVTWTRRSNHTLGRAADIVVNGGYDDTQAYATLQRVAREEGLHTLGMRDPGHVELPKHVGGTLAGGRPGMVDLADVSRIAPDARVRVTEVSVQQSPAPAAGAARVAQVA